MTRAQVPNLESGASHNLRRLLAKADEDALAAVLNAKDRAAQAGAAT